MDEKKKEINVRLTAREAVEIEQKCGCGYAFLVGTIKAMARQEYNTPSQKIKNILLLLDEFDRIRNEREEKQGGTAGE